MTGEGGVTHVVRRLTEAALRLRRPARRLAGSVRVAVALLAIVVGGYTLLIGGLHVAYPYYFYNLSGLVYTTGAFSYITSAMDVILLCSIIYGKEYILQRVVSTTIAIYLICVPLSLSSIIGVAFSGHSGVPLWETPRLGVSLLHLGLIYCLLVELRGDLPPESPKPAPPAGWLQNNLSQEATRPLTGEEVLLKVNVDRNPALNNRATPTTNNIAAAAATVSVHQSPPVSVSDPPNSSEA